MTIKSAGTDARPEGKEDARRGEAALKGSPRQDRLCVCGSTVLNANGERRGRIETRKYAAPRQGSNGRPGNIYKNFIIY